MLYCKAEAFNHFNRHVGSMVLSVMRNQTNTPATAREDNLVPARLNKGLFPFTE